MTSCIVSYRTSANVNEANNTFTCRWLVLALLISINICSQVSCAGVFQFRVTSFENDRGHDSLGRCCDGNPPINGSDECLSSCRTFFWICLRHFQRKSPTTDLECTFGKATTEATGQNSFNESNNLVSIPFDFTWPGSFALFIRVWHDSTGVGPSEGSNRTLIAEFSIQRSLDVSHYWLEGVNVSRRSRLAYHYRVICSENYIGTGCSEKCTPRDDMLGHYNCSQNESKVCLAGWTGEYCITAICLDSCSPTNGYCNEPFECKCRQGWQGSLCDECLPYPGCLHGGCNDRWQCNCFEGWGGLYCNQDLNFCANNEPCVNGATCKNFGEGSYTCLCPVGFAGTNCEIEVFDCYRNACENGAVCEQQSSGVHRCICREGFSGRRCETNARSCQDNPCRNLGTCHSLGDSQSTGYRCECPPGFTGSNCEVNVDECDSEPCLNGGRCIDKHRHFRCVCSNGFTGDRCERDLNDCLESLCLNGGSCLDGVNHFRCRCVPGFTGDLCQDNVDDCMTHPCANGGTCLDRNNTFLCHCSPGFTGRDCSVKIDECQSRPCVMGTCRDLLNGYRCECDRGFAGTNCDTELPFRTPSPVQFETPNEKTPEVTNTFESSTPFDHISPETEDPTDSYLRQTALVVCLGLLLTLLILCSAVVAIVLHRRNRLRVTARSNSSQKMNNAELRDGVYNGDTSKGVGHSEPLKPHHHHHRQRYQDFAAREQVQLQRNINHTNNLKNIEKCPNQKQKMFAWDIGLDSNTIKSLDRDSPEAKTNRNTPKQSDGILSKQVPPKAVSGSLRYFRPDPVLSSERTIATEV